MITVRLVCLAALSYQAFACLGGGKKGDVFKRMVGKDVARSPYSGTDHPVNTGDELACTFDGGCCWSNANPPTDQLDWESLSGATEKKKMQSSFKAGDKNPPDGNFLGVGSETGTAGNTQQAQFYSCPIVCADGPITVNLRHWQTKDVTMQVCEENAPDGPTSSCQPLSQNSGDPDTATVPGGQNVRLVITASGFTEKKGSVGLLDDISVKFTPCDPSSPTQAPSNACGKITCNFESGNPCSYSTAQVGGGSKHWDVVQAPYKNPLTGIPKASEGESFAGTYLNPGDTAYMYTNVNYPQNYVIRFAGYRATEGVDLSACCDSPESCPFSMSKQVQVSDFKNWQSSTVTCPPGTRTVIFKARNYGRNQGAVGLDNVQLLVPGGQPAC